MDTYFLLALPRLHAELAALPEGCRTLWPGLPHRPEQAWEPPMPWPAPMAAACLEDYERAGRDGASGAPVLPLSASPLPADLSAAEQRALREMSGLPAEVPEQPFRKNAQQILLLIWLQEKQALEMAALKQKIGASRQTLASLISGRVRTGERTFLPDENELPDWNRVLAATLAFLPDMPASTAFFISSRSMAESLGELKAPAATAEGLPDQCRHVVIPVNELAELCGRQAHDRLRRNLAPAQWQRSVTLCIPDKLW